MKTKLDKLYQKAFDLKNAGRFRESIAELKRILKDDDDPKRVCPVLIASLYYYELKDHRKALPFAKQAVKLKPENEMASLCLVHCLFQAEKHAEVTKEIRRYVATGGKLESYQTLFDENGVTAKDFT
jgi:tetratricopeptide (TPR) repeat protein